MRPDRLSQRRVLLGLLLLAVGLPAPAAGGSAFSQLLDVLRANGTIGDDAYLALREAAEADALQAHVGAGRARGSEVRTRKGRVEIRSPDEEFEFHFGGRLVVDGAWYRDDRADLGDGLEVRAARLKAEGTVWRDWDFEVDVDFADDEVDLKDVYLEYGGLERLSVRAGYFKEPFSLEELTSALRLTFMERGLPNVLAPGRNLGLGLASSGRRWSLAAGAFGQGIDEPDDGDQSWGVTSRGTFVPLRTNDALVHLGVSFSYRGLEDEDSLRFRSRPESHKAGVRLIDTGTIGGVDDLLRYGLEAAAVLGPVSLQGELIGARLDRSGASPLNFRGWYAYLSWFLTGESRPYKSSSGTFGRIKPRGPLRDGGPGAVEVALRFSGADLTAHDVIGGEQEDVTAGLNWYVARNLRFMANWVKVLEVDRPGSATDGDEPSLFQLRAQLDF